MSNILCYHMTRDLAATWNKGPELMSHYAYSLNFDLNCMFVFFYHFYNFRDFLFHSLKNNANQIESTVTEKTNCP